MCFGIANILSFFWPFQHYIFCIIFSSTMPKPVYLLTVQEEHKEYNSLVDQIWTKYKQLDSDEFGTVGTPSIWYWSLWIGQFICSHEPTMSNTEPANAKGTWQAHVLQALHPSRITRWLSTP